MAFPTITRDDSFVNKLGGGYQWAKEIDSDGSDLGTPDTIKVMGRVQARKFTKTATQTKEADAGGDSIVVSTETEATFEYTSMQRNAATITLPDVMEGRYARFVGEITAKKMGPAADTIQYLVIGNATPEPSLTIDDTNMFPAHKWNCKAVEVAVTETLTVSGKFGSQDVDVSLAVGDIYQVVEMTAA